MDKQDQKIQVRVFDEQTKTAVTTSYDELSSVSDGYHTFKELYHYRMLLQANWFNELYDSGFDHIDEAAKKHWDLHKSWNHSDGQPCFGKDNYFIVMVNLPTGQISNHYKGEYWDLFHIDAKENASEWDGHTPADAADRMQRYIMGDWGDGIHAKSAA